MELSTTARPICQHNARVGCEGIVYRHLSENELGLLDERSET